MTERGCTRFLKIKQLFTVFPSNLVSEQSVWEGSFLHVYYNLKLLQVNMQFFFKLAFQYWAYFWRGKYALILNVRFGFIHRSSKWRWSDSCVLLQGALEELCCPFFMGTSQTAHTGGDPAWPWEVRQLLALQRSAVQCTLRVAREL